jgi:acetoin utilization protein AcuB
MLVGDRMSHPVISISPTATLEDAQKLMLSEKISRLPVLDKHGKLLGIISEKQIWRYMPSEATTLDMWEIKGALSHITVEKVMTKNVITVTADTPIEEAARIMADKEISGIPVISGETVVGLIAESDLFKTFLEVLGAREPGIRLTVSVPKKPGELAALTSAIFNAGGDIISLGTFYGPSGDTGEITVKVAGLSEAVLLEKVKPTVQKVLDVRKMGIV